MKKPLLFLTLFTVVLILFIGIIPAGAEQGEPQVFYYTPTPDSNGRIIYIVKAGDTCISISLLTGIAMDELRLLNDLTDESCSLYEGQELLLGIAEAPVGTPGPTPTPTSLLPTPTAFAGNAEVCIYLYTDTNGNAMADEDEFPLGGGAVSLSDTLGEYSETMDTEVLYDDEGDPVLTCFQEVPQGEYNVSIAIPDGYNATSNVNYSLQVYAGNEVILNFGAQLRADSSTTDLTETEEGASLWIGIVGAGLIAGGLLLGLYAWFWSRANKNKPGISSKF